MDTPFQKIDSIELLRNEDNTSPPTVNVIKPISVPLPPLSPTTILPSPKLSMTPE